MKSYEIIKQAVDEQGVKAVAGAMGLSPALIYKWTEAPCDEADKEQSGTKNPLDRVRELYLLTKDIRLIRFLCAEAGGFFVPNPVPNLRKTFDENVFTGTREMVREFSELLDEITESVDTAPGVEPAEAEQIREKWEDLKSCVERFVVACEKGHYLEKKK